MTPRFRESGSLGCAWTVLSPGISWTWIRPEETRRQARCLVNRGSVFSADQSRFGPGASRLFPDLVQEPESEFLEAAKQAALGDRDQLLDEGAQLLRLLLGRDDPAVLDQRPRHVAEHGEAMTGVSAEFTAGFLMSHDS